MKREDEDAAVAAMVDAEDKSIGYERCRHMLKAALAAIEARGLVVEQGWLPIESAPRDGTTILGAEFLKGVGDWSYRQVAWGEGVDLMSDDEVRVFGWVDDVDGYVHPPPTHFIILAPPLPSPPASQEQQT